MFAMLCAISNHVNLLHRNFSLLSFGEEAEEDEEETSLASEKMKNKSKSAHDLTRDRSLSSAPAIPK